MNYLGIEYDSYANGEGIRDVLWVCGCEHCCPGCQNPESWDFNGGSPLSNKKIEELLLHLEESYISGLTISGGDPLHQNNIKEVTSIAKLVKEKIGKSIWIYTGYEWDDVKDKEIVKYIDVIVTGKYMKDLPKRKWAGSNNQIIYRLKDGEIIGTL